MYLQDHNRSPFDHDNLMQLKYTRFLQCCKFDESGATAAEPTEKLFAILLFGIIAVGFALTARARARHS